MANSTALLIAVKSAVRKVENLVDVNYDEWLAAREEARALRRSISEEMESVLNSSAYEDRGDLLAQYRTLRKLHEMLAL